MYVSKHKYNCIFKDPRKDVTLSPNELQSVKDGKSLYVINVFKSNN
jgi:hypothetical protein